MLGEGQFLTQSEGGEEKTDSEEISAEDIGARVEGGEKAGGGSVALGEGTTDGAHDSAGGGEMAMEQSSNGIEDKGKREGPTLLAAIEEAREREMKLEGELAELDDWAQMIIKETDKKPDYSIEAPGMLGVAGKTTEELERIMIKLVMTINRKRLHSEARESELYQTAYHEEKQKVLGSKAGASKKIAELEEARGEIKSIKLAQEILARVSEFYKQKKFDEIGASALEDVGEQIVYCEIQIKDLESQRFYPLTVVNKKRLGELRTKVAELKKFKEEQDKIDDTGNDALKPSQWLIEQMQYHSYESYALATGRITELLLQTATKMLGVQYGELMEEKFQEALRRDEEEQNKEKILTKELRDGLVDDCAAGLRKKLVEQAIKVNSNFDLKNLKRTCPELTEAAIQNELKAQGITRKKLNDWERKVNAGVVTDPEEIKRLVETGEQAPIEYTSDEDTDAGLALRILRRRVLNFRKTVENKVITELNREIDGNPAVDRAVELIISGLKEGSHLDKRGREEKSEKIWAGIKEWTSLYVTGAYDRNEWGSIVETVEASGENNFTQFLDYARILAEKSTIERVGAAEREVLDKLCGHNLQVDFSNLEYVRKRILHDRGSGEWQHAESNAASALFNDGNIVPWIAFKNNEEIKALYGKEILDKMDQLAQEFALVMTIGDRSGPDNEYREPGVKALLEFKNPQAVAHNLLNFWRAEPTIGGDQEEAKRAVYRGPLHLINRGMNIPESLANLDTRYIKSLTAEEIQNIEHSQIPGLADLVNVLRTDPLAMERPREIYGLEEGKTWENISAEEITLAQSAAQAFGKLCSYMVLSAEGDNAQEDTKEQKETILATEAFNSNLWRINLDELGVDERKKILKKIIAGKEDEVVEEVFKNLDKFS